MTAGPTRRRLGVPAAILCGSAVVIALGALLAARADSRTNRVPLTAAPKGVTVIAARAAQYRPYRRYVGTVEPWVEARIGPQLVAAYVDSVLVRPGDRVTRGQVLATLDCRNASASSRAVAMQARAIAAQREAVGHEAARLAELKAGGFASSNEIEKSAAESASKEAQLMETRAKIDRAALEVNDCVLRAPFAGEVAARLADPGAFLRPGGAVATVIDRSKLRVTAEVPENDFAVVVPGASVDIHALAGDRVIAARITRRSPAADPAVRTVHIEIDLTDAARALPVGTTAELTVDAGAPIAAAEIPLAAASVRGAKATLFTVDGEWAHKRTFAVHGERQGALLLDAALAPGTAVVVEGRTLLNDGDRVFAASDPVSPRSAEKAP